MSTPTQTPTRSRLGALIAASALVAALGVGVAPSFASESPEPADSASPEATTTSEDDHSTNPDFVPPESVDTYVGQSVQVRKNADGFPNAEAVNFRWAVTQVNAESLNGLDVSVPLPMDEAPGLRSLTGAENEATTVDGGVLYQFEDVNGNETKRTLNLWPQDRNLPVDVTAEFTLDGEKVDAQAINGAGGLVTATYTIVNQSVETIDAEFENVKGEDDTQEVETSQAFVGISKQFIPQSWGQFDPGHGIFGADGRGNYQTQWITLAFLPFAEGGKASFGWSAVIPEGQGFIPKMVIEVSPLYIPAHQPEEEEETAEADNGVPKPNLDPATASVQSGVEDLVAGISSLADTIGEAGDVTKEGVQIAISQVKAAVAELCAPDLLDCAAPEPEDPLELSEVIAGLDGAVAAINGYIADAEATGEGSQPDILLDYLRRIEEDVTTAKTEAEGALKEANDALLVLEPAYTEYCTTPSVDAGPATVELCDVIEVAIGFNNAAVVRNNATIVAADAALGVIDEMRAYIDANLGSFSIEKLKDLSSKLAGINESLKGIQAQIDLLTPPLQDLQAGIDQIGAAIDAGGAILGDVGSSLDQIGSGKAQISAGLGLASDEVSAYIANVVAVAQAAAAEGKDVAAEIEAEANRIKAELAGLKVRMAESPLPYGGGMNTAYAPTGDADAVQTESIALLPNTEPLEETEGIVHTRELFGAYQFMLDPADSNHSNTPIRIVLAFVFVVGAGFIGMWASKRAST